MSLLEDLNDTLAPLGIPIETGVFQDTPPEEYLVVTPLSDSFGYHADNLPQYEVQEARLSFFKKGSYTKQKNAIVRALLAADFSITDRRYIVHEDDTGYHHYAIDVAKHYEMEG
ncbi:hypothetical protein [Lactonifactor longoviformis]|uniref:hypothetical protein n=1 Tax=Lactonifactor longoviformis TaxID=341220 RepID=UPI0036F4069F